MPRKVFTPEDILLATNRYNWHPDDYWVSTFKRATQEAHGITVTSELVAHVYRELIVTAVRQSSSFIVPNRICELFVEEQRLPSFESGDDTEEIT